jgi:hypothetical protein
MINMNLTTINLTNPPLPGEEEEKLNFSGVIDLSGGDDLLARVSRVFPASELEKITPEPDDGGCHSPHLFRFMI